ncbi:MAG TPA: DNA alkylation repair protein [Archangium sp.]|nr:DNA alkylation repair protein [Archangium sp.]
MLAWLEKQGTKKRRDEMARYAIPSANAFGVTVSALRKYARELGKDHALAQALWATGRYEARMLAAMIDEPAKVTAAQMDRWCRDFDSWAICDMVCFALFDQTPHAFAKVEAWSRRRNEFEKRGAFALLWSLAAHDRRTPDAVFANALRVVEEAADDDRNFVKKAVNMALRAVGRRSAGLNAAAVEVAERLAASSDRTSRWIGKDALKDLARPRAVRNTPK